MQQPAQQPPVAMYVVQYVHPDQNNGQVQQQPHMVAGQPVQPIWGPYPQPMHYNGMSGVPMSYIPYQTYIPIHQVSQTTCNQGPARLAPVLNLSQNPASQESPSTPSLSETISPTGSDKPHGSIPGPVQPLKLSNAAPGPPARLPPLASHVAAAAASAQPQSPKAIQTDGSDNALACFATVAAMQSPESPNSSPSQDEDSCQASTSARKRGRPRIQNPDIREDPQNDQKIHDSKQATNRPYKRRNFAVPVDICLPSHIKRKSIANTISKSGDQPHIKSPSGSEKSPMSSASPPNQPLAVLIPGLPVPPRAVTNPVQVPISPKGVNSGPIQHSISHEQTGPKLNYDTNTQRVIKEEGSTEPKTLINDEVKKRIQALIEDEDEDDNDEEAVEDEEVVWMGKDPVKRRKRSSNVFDEVLTMNPLYTAEGFACPECDKKFKFRKHCRRHMVNHSGSKPFKCPKCPRSYTRKDTCQRHAAACRVIPSPQ